MQAGANCQAKYFKAHSNNRLIYPKYHTINYYFRTNKYYLFDNILAQQDISIYDRFITHCNAFTDPYAIGVM